MGVVGEMVVNVPSERATSIRGKPGSPWFGPEMSVPVAMTLFVITALT